MSAIGDLNRLKVGPYRVEGKVVKGFGRGSKELGIPTANFDEHVVSALPQQLQTGIYFGWTQLEHENILRKAVVSVGWNPYYHNIKKSVETHIMWKYEDNFYDKWLRVLFCGYLRPEKNYDSLESLIEAIHADIRLAEEALDQEVYRSFQHDPFFANTTSPSSNV